MSSSFKVQKLSSLQANSLENTGINKVSNKQTSNQFALGQINFNIPTISVLNYSSHALIQVISSLFISENDMPSYKQIQKSLEIISFSINNDQMLKSDLEKLLLKNLHKKNEVYLFFCLWSQYLQLNLIIQIFEDNKCQERLIYLILLAYLTNFSKNLIWYQNLAMKQQYRFIVELPIFTKSHKIIEELEAQISNLKIEKYTQFEIILRKLLLFVNQTPQLERKLMKIPMNFIKSKNNCDYIKNFLEKFILSPRQAKNTHFHDFISLVEKDQSKQVKYIVQNSLFSIIDKKYLSSNKQQFFQLIKQVFSRARKALSSNFIISTFKKWFLSNLMRLWAFFKQNFQFYYFSSQKQDDQISQRRNFSFQLLNQLSKQDQNSQRIIQKIILSNYLFHYFQGMQFNFVTQLNFLEQNNQQIPFKQERQIILKGLNHLKNENFVNLIIFNKANFSSAIDWITDKPIQQLLKDFEEITILKKVLNKFKECFQIIYEQQLGHNKKIQLLFSVLRIEINKKPICVSFLQFAQLIKQNAKGIHINLDNLSFTEYQKQYSPIYSKQTELKSNKQPKVSLALNQKQQQQIHPIIIQARIIKLMKKQLKKASIQEIAKNILINEQKIRQIVKKLVAKGYLEQNQDETYSYQP